MAYTIVEILFSYAKYFIPIFLFTIVKINICGKIVSSPSHLQQQKFLITLQTCCRSHQTIHYLYLQ